MSRFQPQLPQNPLTSQQRPLFRPVQETPLIPSQNIPQLPNPQQDRLVDFSGNTVSVQKKPAAIGSIILGGVVLTAIGTLTYFVIKYASEIKEKNKKIEDLEKKAKLDCPDCVCEERQDCNCPLAPEVRENVRFSKLDEKTGNVLRCVGRVVKGKYIADECNVIGTINLSDKPSNEVIKRRLNDFLKKEKEERASIVNS